ncbi:MAG: signal peptidase II, partial [Ruthenibacterium sp.]
VLILAGGIGNLIDRVLNGVVVDFFEVTFMNFAVFNVADCFVCVGAALLLLFFVLEEVKNKKGTSHADS